LYWPSTASWTPADLADLRAWYKADAITGLSDGDPVSTWSDSSGGGYDLTQTSTARPLYQTNTLNGLPVVEFDGSDDFIEASTAADWAFLNTAGGAEVLAVWKAGTSADPEGINALFATNRGSVLNQGAYTFHDSRSALPRDDVIASAVRNSETGGTGDNYYLAPTGDDFMPANTAALLNVTFDCSNSTADYKVRHRLNGGTAVGGNTSTKTASTSNPLDPLRLGYLNGSVGFLNGYIAEVVICDALLSGTDREKVEGYLAHKWGLESNLPSTHPYKSSAP